ncbi:Hpt domain-containing protein [Gimibacter soli]|uniref:Hpt domain-containing protein n=1 Tax=Gimibacter soli TaxID=3024400 RepID=A0AAE9XUN0_9PROT|nr:Hpt domain-containing protein [Gimibacter soli]WCL53079.1 Hpt domain-containing protein [Gimibacter soli]
MANGKPVIVRFYRFKNRLKEKTAGLNPSGKVSLSAEAMEEAEKALSKMSEDYPDWVSGLVGKMQEQHGRCVDTPESRKECFEEIARIAHDMKGQGGTFGYPLITAFSDSLYGFTQIKGDIEDAVVELVKAHIDAMRAVIRGRVAGSGGDIGKSLTEGLNEAIAKYST